MTPDDATVIAADRSATPFDPSQFWWVWLIVGIAWIAGSLVILQFEHASVTTVSLIIGIMFIVGGVQQFALAAVADSMRWLWVLFGCLYLVAGCICLINPEDTFRTFADILGFLLATVGLWWIVRAFLTREVDSMWWLGLVGGLLLLVMGFESAGQLFIDKAYTLLVFAGLWALMQGVLDVVRAFQVRAAHQAG